MLLVTTAAVPGCSGCWKEDPLARKRREEDEAKKKKPEKPKPDFEFARVEMLPGDASLVQQLVKEGHWGTAVQPIKANNFDFQAELEFTAVRRGGEPLDIPHTAYRTRMSRPAALPKGVQKYFETLFYVPPTAAPVDGTSGTPRAWLESRLRARRGGREVDVGGGPTTPMPSYQYYLVVLCDNPDRYGFLKLLDSVNPPVDDDEDFMLDTVMHYRVVLPKIDNRVPLPSQALTWTSMAYIVWDGLNPNLLTPPQQQAMLDWLHWGGQIIVNGPNSLDQLRGSFLEPYLPARGGQAVMLGPERFTALDQTWSLFNPRLGKQASLGISADKPLVGVELFPVEGAQAVADAAGLVLERRAGQGRIVVSAFNLTDRRILNWGSFDGFFNGALLRRPPRKFHLDPQNPVVQVEWREHRGKAAQLDARFVTGLRYFSRDASGTSVSSVESVADAGQSSVAAWNDRSAVAEAARQSLREAAGISIPKSSFVFQVLAVYLIVLVPVNWLLFRLLGRVEWAWVAAPLIAIGGALAVVRLAQLDIGFARSRTEVAVLELQEAYPRAHLTRYSALYTSLSASYDLLFDDESALALPFPSQIPFSRNPLDPVRTAYFRRDRQIRLSEFLVDSNTTGLVHSEQMYPLGGSLQLAGDEQRGWSLRNATALELQEVEVWQRTKGDLLVARPGGLVPGDSAPLKFTALPADANPAGLPAAAGGGGGELKLGRLYQLVRQQPLAEGDLRLVAGTDQELPGMTVRPRASQSTVRTLVLAHLRRGQPPPARPDANLKDEFESATIPLTEEPEPPVP